jgi:threonyl-tRNA synthetase
MAHAVKELFPDVKLAIGPAISDGFYYDIDYDHSISQEDLPRIEKKMKEIIKANRPFIKKEMSKDDAIKLFSDNGETYKVELLQEMDDETVTVYEEGDFLDLCRGPHLESAGKIKAFKLLSVAGAYWRGDTLSQRAR